MSATDFQKKLNLLVRAIREGLPEPDAREQLEETLKYALFPSEMEKAQQTFKAEISARGTSTA
ncbi:MAG: hypothetical protein PHH21_01685 [Candidatus Pacebacteria bacterium]|nr:hypothetical protein [Candidatus Paceibacterota bacterium]